MTLTNGTISERYWDDLRKVPVVQNILEPWERYSNAYAYGINSGQLAQSVQANLGGNCLLLVIFVFFKRPVYLTIQLADI